MRSQLLFGPTFVDGVRPEVASAILEMLAICPRAMCGMCGFQPALMLRLSADEQEVSAALTGMESAGLIERAHSAGSIPQWQLSAGPQQGASSFRAGQVASAVTPSQTSRARAVS